MRQIQPDLWETEPEFPAPGLKTHAYLWVRPDGNVLLYNTTLESELDEIERLGGVRHHYLSHQDEIASSLRTIRDRFGSTLHIHASEGHLLDEVVPEHETFSDRHVIDGEFEIIPTPGHTPGSTCFIVHGAGGQYLFTGDTLIRGSNGHWFTAYFDGFSDYDALVNTLEMLSTLSPDIIISSAFSGDSGVTVLGDDLWPLCVNEALDGLRRS
ncbi:MBL fold metallo-hydrolase [Hoyosella rhizosphaerae]|uniref:MBL fold metallo-hydrolase n=1 Tax=Hoyosella rhizosphaerae TaxID=1755582 RepID=A0A916XB40_9ACTN|nr:MBL fold metallo-hydrolase [Hoyosella rhizosphaerae]MBN4926624.1 MBL fold metallo-hydrolase [Hoyosella rhizosphaerae]GGC57751.1 MBL fold metallo-hydrolase [Hoyosella rhizosphaerae]